jgi:hypothetical protein
VVRTVWLALFCLLGLGIVVAVRLCSEISPAAVSAAMIDSALPVTTAAKPDAQQDTLGKADKLPVFHDGAEVKAANTPPPTEVVSVGLAPTALAASPKIVGRHWHDPNSITAKDQTSANRHAAGKKDSKKNDAVAAGAAVIGSTCSQGSALLRTLKLVPSC